MNIPVNSVMYNTMDITLEEDPLKISWRDIHKTTFINFKYLKV